MSITKIVITQGPCEEKSTALNKINKYFSEMGYVVIRVPKTELPDVDGCTSETKVSMCKEYITELLENEKLAQAEAGAVVNEKVLIVCAAGTMDCKSILNDEEFTALCRNMGLSRVMLRDRYDGVFCIEEGGSEQLLSAWVGHTHMRICSMEAILSEIAFFLGEPKPLEIERKFLISYPDLKKLEADPLCRRVSISQTYLKDDEGNFRVRKRGEADGSIFFMTRKKQISPVVRIEIENRISETEYEDFIEKSSKPRLQVEKDRYCLIYKGQYFEIDVFPFWNDRALMEIELKSEDEKIELPPQFEVIREVTLEEEYKNSNIAKMLANK